MTIRFSPLGARQRPRVVPISSFQPCNRQQARRNAGFRRVRHGRSSRRCAGWRPTTPASSTGSTNSGATSSTSKCPTEGTARSSTRISPRTWCGSPSCFRKTLRLSPSRSFSPRAWPGRRSATSTDVSRTSRSPRLPPSERRRSGGSPSRRRRPFAEELTPKEATVAFRAEVERYTWNALTTSMLGAGRELGPGPGLAMMRAAKLSFIVFAMPGYRLLRKLPLPHDLKARKAIRPLDDGRVRLDPEGQGARQRGKRACSRTLSRRRSGESRTGHSAVTRRFATRRTRLSSAPGIRPFMRWPTFRTT